MRKCVHTIAIDNWFPEMCAITLPLIKTWANKIGANFNIISKSSKSPWPPYEKMQIWETGKDYDWNIYLDADMVVNPDKMPDFTQGDPKSFYYEAHLFINTCFNAHPYFIRHGGNVAISDCFVATSSMTHDLWCPPLMSFEEAEKYCRINKRMVSEFVIALNIARFNLKGVGSIGQDKNHFHLQTDDDYNRPFNGGKAKMTKEEHVTRALEMAKKMGIKI